MQASNSKKRKSMEDDFCFDKTPMPKTNMASEAGPKVPEEDNSRNSELFEALKEVFPNGSDEDMRLNCLNCAEYIVFKQETEINEYQKAHQHLQEFNAQQSFELDEVSRTVSDLSNKTYEVSVA